MKETYLRCAHSAHANRKHRWWDCSTCVSYRDVIAVRCLRDLLRSIAPGLDRIPNNEGFAIRAYGLADAMLAERDRTIGLAQEADPKVK